MAAYYNEIDPYAAEWLRNLIAENLIAPGEVDERSIEDVSPDDMCGFTQCHFFAGIGVWSYALRLAGWPDDREIWTGSCPCQPFSAAGQSGGFANERHLWPAWFHLIEARRPSAVVGEQVASKAADDWVDLVQADLEGVDYAFGAVPFPAAGVGAPHIRDRDYWVAIGLEHCTRDRWIEGWTGAVGWSVARRRSTVRLDDDDDPRSQGHAGYGGAASGRKESRRSAAEAGLSSGLADNQSVGSGTGLRYPQPRGRGITEHSYSSATGWLADGDGGNACAEGLQRSGEHGQQPQDGGVVRVAVTNSRQRDGVADGEGCESDRPEAGRIEGNGVAECGGAVRERPSPTNGFWRDADWLLCRDERWRPVEPGSFPLAHGAPARVGRLRAYGNAIVAEAAATFIEAVIWSTAGDLA